MAAVSVLGVSGLYHDAAAALVRDGVIVAAAQEERFSRVRYDPRFPRQAINYCLEEAFIKPSALNAVVFYDDPLLTLDRVMRSLLGVAPRGEAQWLAAAPSMLGVKARVTALVRESLGVDLPVLFTRHHLSHAASAFYPSPFARAAILTMDGVGEWATTSIARGEGERIEMLKEVRYPHSLGLLYSAFTAFCGFQVNSDEYKLMGLAQYGSPRYAERIREHLLHTKEDGSFRLNTEYFGFIDSLSMTNERFHALFDGPPRVPESRITRREVDLAASIQVVLNDAVLGLARHACELTGLRDLAMAGGVALNCVANGVLQRARLFDRIWIQPAAGDAAARWARRYWPRFGGSTCGVRGPVDGRDAQKGSYLGPAYSGAEVRAFLDQNDYPYEVITDTAERARRVARALAEGKVVGHVSGRMEYGPRALGARSILADPRGRDTQTVLNRKIKQRESFRPFGPSVLAERAADYFEMDGDSPYMLFVMPVQPAHRRPMDRRAFDAGDDDLLTVVQQVRSDIPAVTHVDYSARVQTVRRADHPAFYAVIEAFEQLTGCPVLVNTSLNVRGEPIVCTPQQAYRCFMRTAMDMLVLEDCVLLKDEQPPYPRPRVAGGE